MQVDPAAFTGAAPLISRLTIPSSGSDDQQIQSGGGTADEQAQYSAALRAQIKATKGLTEGGPYTMLFRLAAAQLPAGAAAAWMQQQWELPAAELAAAAEWAQKLAK